MPRKGHVTGNAPQRRLWAAIVEKVEGRAYYFTELGEFLAAHASASTPPRSFACPNPQCHRSISHVQQITSGTDATDIVALRGTCPCGVLAEIIIEEDAA